MSSRLLKLVSKKHFPWRVPFNYHHQTVWGTNCPTGMKEQSPIDIPDISQLKKCKNHYISAVNYPSRQKVCVECTGDTFSAFFNKEEQTNSLKYVLNGQEALYHLENFHFHTPSEHTFQRAHEDLEMHMVHIRDPNSNVELLRKAVVIGVRFKVGEEENPFLADLLKSRQEENGIISAIEDAEVDLRSFLDPNSEYFFYEGSLTTPGCDAIVNWVINTKCLSMSKWQFEKLESWIKKTYPTGNARAVQPLNHRQILHCCKY